MEVNKLRLPEAARKQLPVKDLNLLGVSPWATPHSSSVTKPTEKTLLTEPSSNMAHAQKPTVTRKPLLSVDTTGANRLIKTGAFVEEDSSRGSSGSSSSWGCLDKPGSDSEESLLKYEKTDLDSKVSSLKNDLCMQTYYGTNEIEENQPSEKPLNTIPMPIVKYKSKAVACLDAKSDMASTCSGSSCDTVTPEKPKVISRKKSWNFWAMKKANKTEEMPKIMREVSSPRTFIHAYVDSEYQGLTNKYAPPKSFGASSTPNKTATTEGKTPASADIMEPSSPHCTTPNSPMPSPPPSTTCFSLTRAGSVKAVMKIPRKSVGSGNLKTIEETQASVDAAPTDEKANTSFESTSSVFVVTPPSSHTNSFSCSESEDMAYEEARLSNLKRESPHSYYVRNRLTRALSNANYPISYS